LTIWGPCAAEIREQLCATTSPLKRFGLLEKALLARLFRPLTHHAAVALARSNSCTLVRGLAREEEFRFQIYLEPEHIDESPIT
jgi:hypothetical protein